MTLDLLTLLSTPAVRSVAISGVIGYASGYALKKVGRIVLISLGFFLITLQYLHWEGVITINYRSLEAFLSSILSRVLELQGVLLGASNLLGIGFASGFTLGLYKG
jgi:uncharacterized membrane protein (Fun14 family)